MKRYDLLTPEGTRDQLFDECLAKRTIQEKLRKIFTAYGYSEVITPGLEFYDVFNSKTRYFPPETMYKLVDGKNRLMVMRPDNTMPIDLRLPDSARRSCRSSCTTTRVFSW